MTGIPAEHLKAASTADHIGQGTAVEQSRAVAEVHASVLLAQQRPRNIDRARADLQESCRMIRLAEVAFYSYPRSGKTVNGPSIHLAREAARCWGNIQYGVNELRRDDELGQSEMLAWAWDLQTNTRNALTFIQPHARDVDGQVVALVSLRDIYESNANAGARRLREAIFDIIPTWFCEEAQDLCRATLTKGDETPLSERAAGAAAVFEQLGVPLDRLELKLGKPQDRWTIYDITQLTVTHRSITRSEITIDEAFPTTQTTASEILAAASKPAAIETTTTSPPTVPDGEPWDDEPISEAAAEVNRETELRAAAKTKGVTLQALTDAASKETGTVYKKVAELAKNADHTELMLDWLDSQ